jgi:hypothetical protein
VRTGDDAGIGLAVDDDGLPAVRLELLLDLAHTLAGHAVPGGVAVREQDRKMVLELHVRGLPAADATSSRRDGQPSRDAC